MSEQPKCGHLMIDHGWTCQKPKGHDGLHSGIVRVERIAPTQLFTQCELDLAVHNATMAEHANHSSFMAEIYSIVVDPVECTAKNEAEQWAACVKGATEQREALHNAKERKDLAVLEARIAEAMWWYSHWPSATGEDRIAELQKQKAAIGKA